MIGAGPEGFGHRAHIPGIQAAPGVELIALATAHDETARSAAEHWGVPRWYGSVESLLEDDDVDVVTVSVKPRAHYPLTMAVIESGKAVYCEWPLGLTTDEAIEMEKAAAKRGVHAGVGLQGRWAPEIRHLRDLIGAGHIGKPLSFEVSQALDRFEITEPRSWLHHEEQASGALFVASAHVIDSVRFVLGDIEALSGLRATLFVEDFYADTGNRFEWQASDTVRYVARLTGGQVGSLAVSNITSPPLGFSIRIFGDEGQLAASAPGYYQFTPMTLLGGPRGGEMAAIKVPETLKKGMALPEGDAGTNVGRALSAFGTSFVNGDRFRPDFVDAVGLHRILDAVIQSSDGAGWVTVGNDH